jgi:hypothetical protein
MCYNHHRKPWSKEYIIWNTWIARNISNMRVENVTKKGQHHMDIVKNKIMEETLKSQHWKLGKYMNRLSWIVLEK